MDLMQILIVIVILTSLFICSLAHGQQAAPEETLPSVPDGKTWKMVWNDEFDGKTLDLDKWIYWAEGKRRNGWWSRDAVSLDGKGNLVIKT